MVDANNFGGWFLNEKEQLEKYFKDNYTRAWNMNDGNKNAFHQNYEICCISCTHIDFFVSTEDQLTSSQKNLVSDHPFDGKSGRNPDSGNSSFHFHAITVDG